MSSTLREASKDTLQAKDKTYHYYSLPLAAKSLGRYHPSTQVTQSFARKPAALAGW